MDEPDFTIPPSGNQHGQLYAQTPDLLVAEARQEARKMVAALQSRVQRFHDAGQPTIARRLVTFADIVATLVAYFDSAWRADEIAR